MSMTLIEAIAIARSRANEHAPPTFDLAAHVLGALARNPVRNNAKPTWRDLEQVALLKAELQRVRASFDCGDNGNGHARIDAARMIHQDKHGNVWQGK